MHLTRGKCLLWVKRSPVASLRPAVAATISRRDGARELDRGRLARLLLVDVEERAGRPQSQPAPA